MVSSNLYCFQEEMDRLHALGMLAEGEYEAWERLGRPWPGGRKEVQPCFVAEGVRHE